MSRKLVLTAALLTGLVAGAMPAGAADLDYAYHGPRVTRHAVRSAAETYGLHFADRPYGLASIPFSVGPSGTYPARVIGYVATTCTPYSYRYYHGGCSPRGYGVF